MIQNLTKLSDWIWEIPSSAKQGMRAPARILASEEMLKDISSDKSLEQLMNAATLPGVFGWTIVMPDAHEGYGFPIGGVAALDASYGVISPGGIGYDINCGVRLLKSQASLLDIKSKIPNFARRIYELVPSGVGVQGKIKLSPKALDQALAQGVKWTESQGYAEDGDALRTESYGSLAEADPAAVSNQAKERGSDQLGTMGAGNHFIEIDYVAEIFDEEIARAFGLFEGQIVVQIHSGSRGLGHQVATDYIKRMLLSSREFDFTLPDRELAAAPYTSSLGKSYFGAMCAAANFAWANRQIMTYEIRKAWRGVFGADSGSLTLLYDVAHNIAKLETHEANGEKKKTLVHRKGATRAFPPGHPELPAEFKRTGQPILIPGSMGTESYVLAGLPESMKQTFGSACHGAGRVMSRTQARKAIDGGALKRELAGKGITIEAGSLKGLSEEAPEAYKDVTQVVDVIASAGIAAKVARIVPVAVIKG